MNCIINSFRPLKLSRLLLIGKKIQVCTYFIPKNYFCICQLYPRCLLSSINNEVLIPQRQKYSKTKKPIEESSESEDEVDETDDKVSKVITTHLLSLRVDGVIKSGLGIARNKVETLFYDSRIRVNGRKVPKKSFQVKTGDEIDVIKGFNNLNEEALDVSRVIVLSCKESEEGDRLVVKLRKYKKLTVDNYEGAPWKKQSE